MVDNNSNFFKEGRGSIIFSIFISCVLLLILSVPPIIVNSHYDTKVFKESDTSSNKIMKSQDSISKELFTIEYDRACKEINSRLSSVSQWYERKIYFIGILILGFLYYGSRHHNKKENDNKSIIFSIFARPSALVVLAIAFFIAFTIDLHILSDQSVIDQNGYWIKKVADKTFGNEDSYYTWEQSLRIKDIGYRTDKWFNLFFWPHTFIITVFLYFQFLICSLIPFLRQGYNDHSLYIALDHKKSFNYAYWFIHITILIFSFFIHPLPSVFKIEILFFNETPSYFTRLIYPLIALIILSASLIFYYCPINRRYDKMIEKNRNRKENQIQDGDNWKVKKKIVKKKMKRMNKVAFTKK